MPRKRKEADVPDGLPEATTGAGDTSEPAPKRPRNSPGSKTADIDYDKLADAILRKQKFGPSPIQTQTVLADVVDQPAACSSGSSITPLQQDEEISNFVHDSNSNMLNKETAQSSFLLALDQLFGGGTTNSSLVGSQSNSNSTRANDHLSKESMMLLSSSLSQATKKSYAKSWKLLIEFQKSFSIDLIFPVLPVILANFIGHLHSSGVSPSSIASHCSAISFVHKLLNGLDPCQSFLVKKLLKGSRSSTRNISPDSRLPITHAILEKLVEKLSVSVPDPHSRLLLKSLFLLAYHAFMRLGELVPKSKAQVEKVIQYNDISFDTEKSMLITLKHHKSHDSPLPTSLHVYASGNSKFCPVQLMKSYLATFAHTKGPLFQFKSGLPVSYYFVSNNLSHTIGLCGLNPRHYKGHSFRIGAATDAAAKGLSDTTIQKLGRWKSNAFQRYIRFPAH